MRRSTYKLITWLLAVMMVFSPIPGVASIDLQANEHGAPCAMSSSGTHGDRVMRADGGPIYKGSVVKCEMNHAERCQSHPGCSAHISLSTIIGEPVQLSIPLSISQKLIVTDDSMVTIYPTLPKRPPRS